MLVSQAEEVAMAEANGFEGIDIKALWLVLTGGAALTSLQGLLGIIL